MGLEELIELVNDTPADAPVFAGFKERFEKAQLEFAEKAKELTPSADFYNRTYNL